MANKLPPIHPGEILIEEYLEPMASASISLLRILACLLDASMRS